MIYVLDQNYFRAKELERLVATELHSKFVIPDVALLEMCKGERWKETLEGSLAILSECPGRVFHSLSIGDGLSYELKHGKSVEGKILPRDFRDFTRTLLSNVSANGHGSAIDFIRERIIDAQRDMNLFELNHLNNQQSLLQRVEIIESALAGEPLRTLRGDKMGREDRLLLIRKIATKLCSKFLLDHGQSKNKARMFIKQKPLILRFFYVSVMHCFNWVEKGGIRSMPPDRITNDIVDQDYVLIGSFFNHLLSKEKKVKETDANLRYLLCLG